MVPGSAFLVDTPSPLGRSVELASDPSQMSPITALPLVFLGGGFLLLVSQVQRPEHQCSQIDSIHFAQHGRENAAPRALQDPLPWIYLPLSRIDISSLLSHHSPVTGSSYKMSVARGCF